MYLATKKISRADRKVNALRSKYRVDEDDGLNIDYDSSQTFFRLHRFILDADRTPVGKDMVIMKMSDVGLYLLLNFIAEEISKNNGAKIAIFNSEHIKTVIKKLLGKSRTDSGSSNRINESFYRLEKLGLIKCNVTEGGKTKAVYEDITIPFSHDTLTKSGFFKFYNRDIHTLLDNVKNGSKTFAVKEFLELLGVYTISCLTFYKDVKKFDKSKVPLNNGIVTVSDVATTRYANRIDFTFGLKLAGGVRKKGIKEYMDILEKLGVIVSTSIQESDVPFTIYTFPKNFKQLEVIIRDLYKN